MKRINLSSGAKWEKIVGYSRAVCIGNQIEITGTVATNGGEVLFPNDGYGQTKFILNKIKECVEALGGKLEDIYRTRMFVTDISRWSEFGKAHNEFFKGIYPATTMVEVSRLIDDGYLIEIEAFAMKGVSDIENKVKF